MKEEFGVNEMSTAEIVVKFFKFYGEEFQCDRQINIKEGGFTPKNKLKDNLAFSIIDPFQFEHNPGRSISETSMTYKTTTSKFMDLYERVQEGRVIFDLQN